MGIYWFVCLEVGCAEDNDTKTTAFYVILAILDAGTDMASTAPIRSVLIMELIPPFSHYHTHVRSQESPDQAAQETPRWPFYVSVSCDDTHCGYQSLWNPRPWPAHNWYYLAGTLAVHRMLYRHPHGVLNSVPLHLRPKRTKSSKNEKVLVFWHQGFFTWQILGKNAWCRAANYSSSHFEKYENVDWTKWKNKSTW